MKMIVNVSFVFFKAILILLLVLLLLMDSVFDGMIVGSYSDKAIILYLLITISCLVLLNRAPSKGKLNQVLSEISITSLTISMYFLFHLLVVEGDVWKHSLVIALITLVLAVTNLILLVAVLTRCNIIRVN